MNNSSLIFLLVYKFEMIISYGKFHRILRYVHMKSFLSIFRKKQIFLSVVTQYNYYTVGYFYDAVPYKKFQEKTIFMYVDTNPHTGTKNNY